MENRKTVSYREVRNAIREAEKEYGLLPASPMNWGVNLELVSFDDGDVVELRAMFNGGNISADRAVEAATILLAASEAIKNFKYNGYTVQD